MQETERRAITLYGVGLRIFDRWWYVQGIERRAITLYGVGLRIFDCWKVGAGD